MANPILRTNHHNKAVYVLGVFSILLLIQHGGAFEFTVGGSKGWTTPSDPNAPHYNQWAEKKRFQIGDTLVFLYNADEDSVLWVSQEDYTNCTTTKPIGKYTDGHTKFKLKQSGPHYFISGVHCMKNEKMVVVVMADRSHKSSPASPPTPATEPSPAPSGEESPPPPASPPLSGTVDVNPTPAPEAESPPPPPNSASSITSFIFSIGAFFGSSLFLVL